MRLSRALFFGFFSLAALAEPKEPCATTRSVDLGYAVHEATLDETNGYYAFKNIRYADPPTGELRFQPSRPVSTVNRTVADGSSGWKCPQAMPEWALKAVSEGGDEMNVDGGVFADEGISEDCLFLDVLVAEDILSARGSSNPASVLVWLHGGGYVFGYKDQEEYDPAGIMERSQANGSKGVIYVALNYRLGMFGWLNGQADDRVLGNVGLHDQNLALDWVKTYIGLFGGDPDNITLLGHSAGGGSVIHHITAHGGEQEEELPFQRAIIQSPGWETPNVGAIYNSVLAVASELSGRSIPDGDSLAALDFDTLDAVNQAVVFASSNGSFTFGPTVDGEYVPGLADVLLLEGRFDSSPALMIGHNKNEAGMFVSPDLDTEEEMLAGLQHMFANYRNESVDYILRELYPPPSDTHSLYSTQYERACLIVSEGSFACHTRALATAFDNLTFNYRFDVPPAFHMQDLGYTFYNGEDPTVEGDIAEAMQMYFTTFAKSGKPNYSGADTQWPEYGDDAILVTFGKDDVGTAEDDAKNARCEFWQSGEYWR